VIINLSEDAGNIMLDALGEFMNGGSIELLTDGQRVLAVLKLSTPAAMPAVDGAVELREIAEEDAAPNEGVASLARVLAADGREVFACDVGDSRSDCVIKLGTTSISLGAPVRISSFRLAMP